MSKPDEKLDEEDREAIRLIMALRECDYETARKLWKRFKETEAKIRERIEKEGS
jgi:hypothetical protein